MRELYEQALHLYKGDFDAMYADACSISNLIGGRIVVGKNLMLWGFPVHVGDTMPDHLPIADYADPDAWMVWLAVGTLSAGAVREAMPYPLPRVIFARDNRLRCYNLETLLRHLLV